LDHCSDLFTLNVVTLQDPQPLHCAKQDFESLSDLWPSWSVPSHTADFGSLFQIFGTQPVTRQD
jgi:hypothetical protein